MISSSLRPSELHGPSSDHLFALASTLGPDLALSPAGAAASDSASLAVPSSSFAFSSTFLPFLAAFFASRSLMNSFARSGGSVAFLFSSSFWIVGCCRPSSMTSLSASQMRLHHSGIVCCSLPFFPSTSFSFARNFSKVAGVNISSSGSSCSSAAFRNCVTAPADFFFAAARSSSSGSLSAAAAFAWASLCRLRALAMIEIHACRSGTKCRYTSVRNSSSRLPSSASRIASRRRCSRVTGSLPTSGDSSISLLSFSSSRAPSLRCS
mmetsp:Transcript_47565/g.146774  ORF Transcript_47565/g.146774 Transcript_47565/m.146774 type:complete len:266 (-) Transcript_47565:166-963(-)